MRSIAILCALGGAMITPANAQNQNNCAPRTAVVERLADRYGESQQAIGMATQGRVMEMFASVDTGTWTIIVTMPNGVSCMVASGQSYEALDEPLVPTGIPS